MADIFNRPGRMAAKTSTSGHGTHAGSHHDGSAAMRSLSHGRRLMAAIVAVICAMTALMGAMSLQMANAAEDEPGVMGSWSRDASSTSLGGRLLAFLGLSAAGTPVRAGSVTLPSGATGWGIDVSKWNGSIDWAKVKATGIDFVILRAGYGRGGVDERFTEYVKGCRDNGIRFGVYWYAYSWDAESAKREAENGITPQSIDFPVYYDLENEKDGQPAGVDDSNQYRYITGAENFAAIAKAYCDVIKAAGYTPGYYSNLNWNRNYLTDPYFDTIDRWYAQYNSVPTFDKPFSMWQHTSTGTVDGISGNVDLNYSYGDFLDGVHGGNTSQKTASFTAEKTVSGAPADGAVPGTRLTYSLKVTNTGTADLTDIRYTDPMLGATEATDAPTSKDTLAAGESEEFAIGTYTVTQADVDGKPSMDNTATVSASAPDAAAAPADQTAKVSTQTRRESGIELTKTAAVTTDADGDGLADVGDAISYSFTMRNTGTVTLSSVKLTDAMLGIDGMKVATDLAAGGTATYDATQTHVVTDADEVAGKVDNSASATGTPVYGNAATDTAATSTPVDRGLVDALDVVKTATLKTDADDDGKADPGDVLSYRVTIRNTSERSLENVTITDTLLGIEDRPVKDTLAAGETVSVDDLPDYTVTASEAKKGAIENIAAIRATNGANDLVKDGIARTPADAPNAGMSMSMTATREDGSTITGGLTIGDVIRYSVTVKNTGNVGIPTIRLSDTLGAMPQSIDGGIPAGGSKTVTGTHTVTLADMDGGDTLRETVTASADAVEGMTLPDVTASSETPLDSVAGLTANLAADVDKVTDAEVGTPVSWTLTVENTGTRTMMGIRAVAGDGTEVTLSKTTLAPGETAQARISHPVTQEELDAGKVTLTLTASGSDKLGNDVDVHGNESSITLVPRKEGTGNENANGNNGNVNENENTNANAGGNENENENGNGNENGNENENENENENGSSNGNVNQNTNTNSGNDNTNGNSSNQNQNQPGNSLDEIRGMKVLLNNKVMTDFDVSKTSYTWAGQPSDNLVSVTGVPEGWKRNLSAPSNGIGLFRLSIVSPDGKISLLYSITVRAAETGGGNNQNGDGNHIENANGGQDANKNASETQGNGNANFQGDGSETKDDATDNQHDDVPVTQVIGSTNGDSGGLLQTGDNFATRLVGILSVSVTSIGMVILGKRSLGRR